jgi:hypothetical protein
MNMTHFRSFIFSGLFLFVILYSCVDHNLVTPVVDCTGVSTISYATQVKPIVEANCAIKGCHNGDMGSDYNWTIFSTLQARALSGKLQDRITRPAGAEGHMPKTGSITDSERQAIYCWAAQGAPNN